MRSCDSSITGRIRQARSAATLFCASMPAAASAARLPAACRVRTAGRGPRRRRHRRAQLSPGRRPRGAARRHRADRPTRPRARAALAAMLGGREVTLRGEDDTPDRYGRQPAFVFVAVRRPGAERTAAAGRGAGFARHRPTRTAQRCCRPPRPQARQAKRGIWADPAAIKNAESPGDILAGIGQFTVVEGKVLSVRQAGATTYLNFGRNWTRDFAVTISRRMMPAFEAAGIALKSLENRRIRVRGLIEARGGPRIEVLRVGQIELAWRELDRAKHESS